MPRLNHRKARTGCQRCKARKVKCDELRPRCSACARHDVSCQYGPSNYGSAGTTPAALQPTPPDNPYHAEDDHSGDPHLDPLLETRLMHEWTAYACKTFSTAWEFWMYQAPLIAFKFRHVLDAILAVTALYASRQPPMKWVPLDGRMVPIHALSTDPAQPEQASTEQWKLEGMNIDKDLAKRISNAGNNAYLAVNRSKEMLAVSRFYFDRAIDGHRRTLDDLSIENIEAVYITSILVSFHAIFVLSESEEDSTLPSLDPLQWMRLTKGTRFICARWEELVGASWIGSSGVFYGKPDMTDTTDLFNSEHGRPFLKLLTYAADFESITPEDRKVYQDVISYIGAIYKGISEETEPPMASCRRLMALPSRNDLRFIDFVEAKQPRALAILAHAFACMKLIANKVAWFEGIAERQVPKIHEQVPVGWRAMLAWPLAVMNGEINREPRETYIEDILAL